MNPTKVGRYGIVGVVSRGPDEDVLVGEHGSRRATIRVFHGQDRAGILEDARRVAALAHPNVAQQEVGLHGDEPFLAAEIAGETLPKWGERERALPEQLLVLEGVAAGIGHAHDHGVVHGRLTPERIAVGGDGVARIWGFGLRSAAGQPLAASAYTAPEMAGGEEPTALADVYAVGVVFYELLTRERPTGEAPVPLRELRKDLPKDLADAIMACRERSADWRPKDLDYLLECVHRVRGTLPALKLATPKVAPVAVAPRLRAEERRSPVPLLPIAVGVVVFLGGAVALYRLAGSKAAAPEPAPTTLAQAPAPAAATRPASPVGVAEPQLATPAPAPTRTPTAASTAPTPSPAAAARPSATPAPTPAQAATPPPVAAATALPSVAAQTPTPPPVTSAPATLAPAPGPALLTAVSPPTLRRGLRTLVDVRGQGLYPGLGAALLRGGRPAEGVHARQQRFVSAGLVQVFVEVDADAAAGAYGLLLSDGQNVTNVVRFDVLK
ncbi:MAG TPA: protein kinase [Vicinamibacteria bacterium]|nr:protein kinase [Vicinamibacteria bacterium]